MKIIVVIISHVILNVKMNFMGSNPYLKTKTPQTFGEFLLG